MKQIKTFESFVTNELHIFDLDDTLVETPDFNKMAISYLKENETIGNILKGSVAKIGLSLNDLNWENDRIYVDDPESKITIDGNWVRKGKRIYLLTPHRWSFLDISLPYALKSLSQKYNTVDNKMIITARPEEMRSKIIKIMNDLGLESPNYGLYMFPANIGAGNPGKWKGDMICQLLDKTGFTNVIFYEDNSKTLSKVRRIMAEKMPKINFKTIKA